MNGAIVLNGQSLKREITERYIICADGGYDRIKGKYSADVVLGDLDSIKKVPENIKTEIFDAEKNFTDGELCVDYAAKAGIKALSVYCALGGRIDHTLGNLSLLKRAYDIGIDAVIREKNLDIFYAENTFALDVQKGDTVSIIPAHGTSVVTARGLYYPLNKLKLSQGHWGLGVSNVAVANKVELDISQSGVFIFRYFKTQKA